MSQFEEQKKVDVAKRTQGMFDWDKYHSNNFKYGVFGWREA
jgi:hypothetical protein